VIRQVLLCSWTVKCDQEATVIVRRFGFASHHFCVVHGLATINSDVKEGIKSEMYPFNPQQETRNGQENR